MILTSQFFIITLSAALAALALSSFLYSPKILGNSWMSLAGINKSSCKDCNLKMAVTFVCYYIVAVTLYTILAWAGADSAKAGMACGLWIGLGIKAPGILTGSLWESKPTKLFLINAGVSVFTMVLMGSIIGHLMGILNATAAQ